MALNYSILKSCNRPEIKQDFCHQQWLCLIQGDIHKWSQCLQQLLLLFIKKTKPMWKLNQRLFSDFPLQQTKVLFPAVSCRFQLQFHRHVGLQTDCWCLAVDTGNRKFVKSWGAALGSSYAGLKYLHVFQGHPLPLQVHFPRLFWTWWPNRYPAGPERNEIERPMEWSIFVSALLQKALYFQEGEPYMLSFSFWFCCVVKSYLRAESLRQAQSLCRDHFIPSGKHSYP